MFLFAILLRNTLTSNELKQQLVAQRCKVCIPTGLKFQGFDWSLSFGTSRPQKKTRDHPYHEISKLCSISIHFIYIPSSQTYQISVENHLVECQLPPIKAYFPDFFSMARFGFASSFSICSPFSIYFGASIPLSFKEKTNHQHPWEKPEPTVGRSGGAATEHGWEGLIWPIEKSGPGMVNICKNGGKPW